MQATVEEALSRVLRQPVAATCAGRTDAGVHARGQVCHVDVSDPAPLFALSVVDLRRRLASALAPDVRVLAIAEVGRAFDARFSALWRRYVYRVNDDPAGLDPLRRGEVLAWPRQLDVARMNDAAQRLLGTRDFAAFCRRRRGSTSVRTLLEFGWVRTDDSGWLAAQVVGDAFCHNMVRSLVGAVLAVGDGRRPAFWPAEVLAGGSRDPGVNVAPPHGLTLEEVGYPSEELWAVRAVETRAVRALTWAADMSKN